MSEKHNRVGCDAILESGKKCGFGRVYCPDCQAVYDACPSCQRHAQPGEWGPTHNGSTFCESGSIASGGKNTHCTCDWCF